jgi:lysyl-tRNA synthetase class 1
MSRYYAGQTNSQADRDAFVSRALCAKNWLQKYASENFVYSLFTKPVTIELNPKQSAAIESLKEWLKSTKVDDMEPKLINEEIYAKVIHAVDADPKEVFTAVYQKLIGRNQGPRLPSFLKEIGSKKLLSLL